ncbi:MAG: Na+/H+ antiporter subunit G [Acidimicrobiales bacterium]|nr:Na+/H+ antiporter subunit G [Acidimicrobiales bacterium]
MNTFSAIVLLLAGVVALLAGIGVLRFSTSYARLHAAGKASPIAFIIASVGAALDLGWAGAGLLGIAVFAMTLTLPVGVHLLFRAVHRTGDNSHLAIDELAPAERYGSQHPLR